MGGSKAVSRFQDIAANMESASLRRFSEIDWDFTSQLSSSPFSDLHWHPCRYPAQVPGLAIGRLTNPGEFVLDPFMGSATTLTESQRLGRLSIGIDINPISCLMASAKLVEASYKEISEYIDYYKSIIFTKWDSFPNLEPPPSVQLNKWYTKKTQQDLKKLWYLVQSSNDKLSIILKAVFSGILMSACREERHWGYICDNSEPKSFRERDVRVLFNESLNKYLRAYSWRNENALNGIPQSTVIYGDSSTVLESFEDEKFGCCVTSPPYFGVADYVKSQRLSMEWLEIDIEPSRLREIGARSKRHRLKAGEEYIADLRKVFKQVHRTLKIDGRSLIVFGQSPSRPSAKEEFLSMLESVGFMFEYEQTRQIPDTRRQKPSLKNEYVILVKKA